MKKRQIINQIILMFMFSLPFLYFSCQEDIVYKQKNVNVQMELDYRTDPGNWCDGGQSDPPKFYARVEDEPGGNGKIVYITAAYMNNSGQWIVVLGLEDDMQLATTEFDFCTGTGNHQGAFYENPIMEYFGVYVFHNVIPIGTHFAVEVLGSEENYDGCNVFPWEHDCP